MVCYTNNRTKLTSEALMTRFEIFKKIMGDPSTTPVRMYDPISRNSAEKLDLVRDLSRYLLKKKDDELNVVEKVEAAETKVEQEETTETSEETE